MRVSYKTNAFPDIPWVSIQFEGNTYFIAWISQVDNLFIIILWRVIWLLLRTNEWYRKIILWNCKNLRNHKVYKLNGSWWWIFTHAGPVSRFSKYVPRCIKILWSLRSVFISASVVFWSFVLSTVLFAPWIFVFHSFIFIHFKIHLREAVWTQQ